MTLSAVGGTLTAVGGVLTGLAPAEPDPTFTATDTIHTFDTTDEGWIVNSGVTATIDTFPGMTGTGALTGTRPNDTGANSYIEFDSPQGSGFGTYNLPVGSTIELELFIPAATSGTWELHPAIITTSFTFVYGDFVVIPKGSVQRVLMDVPAEVDGTDHKHMILEFHGSGITGTDPHVIQIGGIRIGTVS